MCTLLYMTETRILIIGGGIHGTFLARSLLRYAGIPRSDLVVLDPTGEPVHAWKHRCCIVGMTHLRSTSSHNMEPDFRSLRRWATANGYSYESHFLDPYARPSLEVFHAHMDSVVSTDRTADRFVKGYARSLRRIREGWSVTTDEGDLSARVIVLATGPGEVRMPSWAHGSRVAHVYGPQYRDPERSGMRIAVIGGGISAWQYACRHAEGHEVTVLSPHDIQVSMFDSDPGYLGPKKLDAYRMKPAREREEELHRARRPGTVPPDLEPRIRESISNHGLEFRICMIEKMLEHESGVMLVDTDGIPHGPYDKVVCATGFTGQQAPGGLVTRIATDLQLPRSPEGYPRLGRDLSWTDGIFVSGGAAALELGPTGGNIIGAHKAYRILRETLSRP
ncbi:MAG: FAD/NAD(P)-binding protein [Spirochaetota bacterium]